MSQSTVALTLGTVTVRQHNGLFCLNDLHQASGNEEKNAPSKFIRLDQTQDLIAEIKSADSRNCLETRRGANGGTYACRELVIAYAAWISAAFHLKVIRVFLTVTAPQTAPYTVQPTAFGQAMTAARENALHYFSAVRAGQVSAPMQDIPAAVLEGIVAESLMAHQFLAGFDYRTGQMGVRLVPRGASVFDFQDGDFAQAVSAIPTKRLPDLQDALNKRIARHLGALPN